MCYVIFKSRVPYGILESHWLTRVHSWAVIPKYHALMTSLLLFLNIHGRVYGSFILTSTYVCISLSFKSLLCRIHLRQEGI